MIHARVTASMPYGSVTVTIHTYMYVGTIIGFHVYVSEVSKQLYTCIRVCWKFLSIRVLTYS